ncbi:hypothetical protein [Actinomadura opuntiae]|uniref:hypothetical protein n=1 Tax=Actinomadura sp. OS1-43 TaxID=604315 RepID=UPI00255AAC90|nr:hypothetical protein [Actinomadura sp. OS1-43]MDL4813064.1 hypothetical protein [Actinomadura sp. OS1-43]
MQAAGVVCSLQAGHAVARVGGLGGDVKHRLGDHQHEGGDRPGEAPGVVCGRGCAGGPAEGGSFRQCPPGVGGLDERGLVAGTGLVGADVGQDGRDPFDQVQPDEGGREKGGDGVGGFDLSGEVVELVVQRILREVIIDRGLSVRPVSA